MNVKRNTAKKCRIKDLLNGRYVKREGWQPNYFETLIGRISRANIIATIVSNQQNLIIIDDGTGLLELRIFYQKQFKYNTGSTTLIIGKPRSFNNQTYLVPEIIKKIDNQKWIELRKLELKKIKYYKKIKEKQIKRENTQNISENLLKKIFELDKGEGVKINDVLNFFESNNANSSINQLIEQGEIFEIKPGIVKTI
jgi:RPA family protein|tara:strand:- start:247 stop:837 length:591 start_codon:yes stop_codon:yes gene_type:complete